jgi:transposase InsO family protein
VVKRRHITESSPERNNRRLLESIGNIPPAEAEERYYAMLEQPALAA